MNTFYGLTAKMYHWYQFTKFCFSERGEQIHEARELTKLAMHALDLFTPEYSTREDLMDYHMEPFLADLLGIYFTSVSHHDSIQTLALSGHSLNSFILLRPQLEAVLAFLYVSEPKTDLAEVYNRVDRYRDWVAVKMKQNLERTQRLDIVQVILQHNYKQTVDENYNIIKEKYIELSSLDNFTKLERANSFLSTQERLNLTRKFQFEDLYNHIYAESSAGIHFADFGDRMEEIEPLRYRFKVRHKRGAFWYVMLSNLLQVECIKQFGVFFGIEKTLNHRLQKIFAKNFKKTQSEPPKKTEY